MTELLEMQGAQVTAAASGDKALRKAAQSTEPYHLIISDIGMPDMDGYMLLGELRKQHSTSASPAIALSGSTRDRDVERVLAAGFETHVCKPIVFDQFLTMAGRLKA